MKKFLLIITLIALSFSVYAVNDHYDQKMKEYSSSLIKDQGLDNNKELVYNFKRLVKTYPNEWQAKYYVAYCLYRGAYLDKDNTQYNIAEALDFLDSIDGKLFKEHADFLILKARILFMVLGMDNSQSETLMPQISSLLKIALEMEPNNSRGLLVLGQYYYYLPAFIGGDKVQGVEKFKLAYENYLKEPASELPKWPDSIYTYSVNLK